MQLQAPFLLYYINQPLARARFLGNLVQQMPWPGMTRLKKRQKAGETGGGSSSEPFVEPETSILGAGEGEGNEVPEIVTFEGTQRDGTEDFIVQEIRLEKNDPTTWERAKTLTGFDCFPFVEQGGANSPLSEGGANSPLSEEPLLLLYALNRDSSGHTPQSEKYRQDDQWTATNERLSLGPVAMLGQLSRCGNAFTQGMLDPPLDGFPFPRLTSILNSSLGMNDEAFPGLAVAIAWRYPPGKVICDL